MNKVFFTQNITTETWPGPWFSIDITVGNGETFTLPTSFRYSYNYVAIWGDGNESGTITTYNDSARAHTYTNAGTYTIEIVGLFESFYVNNDSAIDTKIITVNHWGKPGQFKQINFYGCVNLTSLPSSEVGYLSNVETFLTFCAVCTSLTAIPSGLFDDNLMSGNATFENAFAYCTSLTAIPSGLFDDNTLIDQNAFSDTFQNCTGLTAIPSGLFDENILVSTFGFLRTFQNCTGLTAIPSGLFDNNDKIESFQRTFYNCTSLGGGSGQLWLNPSGAANYTLSSPNYDSGIPNGGDCYYGCTGLTDYGSIPTYWK